MKLQVHDDNSVSIRVQAIKHATPGAVGYLIRPGSKQGPVYIDNLEDAAKLAADAIVTALKDVRP